MKQCSNCNTINDDSSNYCKNCGNKLILKKEVDENKYIDAIENTTMDSIIPKEKKKVRKKFLGVGIILIVVIILVIIISSSLNNASDNYSSSKSDYETTTLYGNATTELSREDRALVALYSKLSSFCSTYRQYNFNSTKYKINTSERGNACTIFYGKVFLYDNYGNYEKDMDFEITVYDDSSIDSYCYFR